MRIFCGTPKFCRKYFLGEKEYSCNYCKFIGKIVGNFRPTSFFYFHGCYENYESSHVRHNKMNLSIAFLGSIFCKDKQKYVENQENLINQENMKINHSSIYIN